jgi:uncharacterized protein YjiS (DUF1127 family)
MTMFDARAFSGIDPSALTRDARSWAGRIPRSFPRLFQRGPPRRRPTFEIDGACNAQASANMLTSRLVDPEGSDEMKNMMISAVMSTKVSRHYGYRGTLDTLTTAFKRGCTAFVVWRVQQVVILYLQSMSDRELHDIGLSRSQIEVTVGRALA